MKRSIEAIDVLTARYRFLGACRFDKSMDLSAELLVERLSISTERQLERSSVASSNNQDRRALMIIALPILSTAFGALIIFHLRFDTEHPTSSSSLRSRITYQINGNLFCSRDHLRSFDARFPNLINGRREKPEVEAKYCCVNFRRRWVGSTIIKQ
jgi:hypothetical protein